MKDLDDQVIGTLHNKDKKNTLTLTQNNLQLQVKEYKSYNPFPNSLIYQVLILSDENVEALSTVSKQMSVYNFKVTDWEKAHNIGSAFITKSITTMQRFKQSIHRSMQVKRAILYIKQN